MRVALVHSYYRSDFPSGENSIVDAQARVLTGHGHEVTVVSRHSDALLGRPFASVRGGLAVATGRGADPTRELESFQPDIVHVHNLFPNFATGWLRRWPGPVVATMHNYRPMCANAMLFRDGQVCTLCPDGDRWAGVKHRCRDDSALATFPIALRNRAGVPNDPVVARSDALIVLSPQALELFTKYGAPRDRIHLIPNGVAPLERPDRPRRSGWVVFGRLSPEKGLRDLLRIWPDDVDLDVIGSGVDGPTLTAIAGPRVRFPGSLDRDALRRRLPSYTGAVFGGSAFEGAYPLAAVESMAAGLPLVARAGGAAAQMVRRWDCGLTFESEPGDLRRALAGVEQEPGFSDRAQATYEEEFTHDSWVSRLTTLYSQLAANEVGPTARLS